MVGLIRFFVGWIIIFIVGFLILLSRFITWDWQGAQDWHDFVKVTVGKATYRVMYFLDSDGKPWE